MTDVLNEIVNDPEMIIMTDEEDEDDVLNEMVAERGPVDPEDVFEKKHQVKESTGPTVEPIKKKDKKEKPVKLTKSGRPRKQMSPEALARLEAGRKKALAARKEKAEAKRKEKEDQLKLRQLEIQAEQVKREKKKKQLKKVINGESSDEEEPKPKPLPSVPAPQPAPAQSVSVNAKIDEDVIQRAIQEALEKQEMMRQKRKAEKKAKQKEEVEKAKAAEKIKQAIYPPDRKYLGDDGFWSKSVFFTQ